MKVTVPQTIIELTQEEAEQVSIIALIAYETLNSSIRNDGPSSLLTQCCVEKHQMAGLRDLADRIGDTVGVTK